MMLFVFFLNDVLFSLNYDLLGPVALYINGFSVLRMYIRVWCCFQLSGMMVL